MQTVKAFSLLSDFDISLFQGGKHFRLYQKLGSHLVECDGEQGVYFAVWAPHARKVAVTGIFNDWNPKAHILLPRWDKSGIWEGFIPGIGKGTVYKYHVTMQNGKGLDKGDPYALRWETPPQTASIVWDLEGYGWNDKPWLDKRLSRAGKPQPWSVYEVHPGSWKKVPEDGNRSFNFRELADDLVPYAKDMGFTHIELMPVMEHPYFPSWGYQITGFFAPSGRFGPPEDFMHFVDACHHADLGVILDWVPSHFPGDIHGLYLFDGSHLYEYADMRRGYHPDWNSYVFDYGRNEVRSFLISNALFWLDKYHIDGLRVDAVASMLYHDYSRKEGEWIPNIHGGRENLEAISFLRDFNEAAYKNFPGIETIAEESTAFPGVSKPTWEGGLGFGQKWMMGWMHDTLNYFKRPPVFRRWHQNEVTFSMVYAFSERFMLPLSHDEVVHMKASLLYKMPGSEWDKFANLRTLFGFQWTHPGSHILFMGGEFGQTTEWSHDRGVVWELLQYDFHKGCQLWVQALNRLYAEHPALWWHAFSPEGYAWIGGDDTDNCVLAFLRKGRATDKALLVVCHFKTGTLDDYTLGVPYGGTWRELLNSDDVRFGGSGFVNADLKAEKKASHGQAHAITIKLAPLAVQIFEGQDLPKARPGKKQVEKTAKTKLRVGPKKAQKATVRS
ncbi:MAG: 1,4-alpha-glucan branching protein GlgB [Saprospiraceae bacterium]